MYVIYYLSISLYGMILLRGYPSIIHRSVGILAPSCMPKTLLFSIVSLYDSQSCHFMILNRVTLWFSIVSLYGSQFRHFMILNFVTLWFSISSLYDSQFRHFMILNCVTLWFSIVSLLYPSRVCFSWTIRWRVSPRITWMIPRSTDQRGGYRTPRSNYIPTWCCHSVWARAAVSAADLPWWRWK